MAKSAEDILKELEAKRKEHVVLSAEIQALESDYSQTNLRKVIDFCAEVGKGSILEWGDDMDEYLYMCFDANPSGLVVPVIHLVFNERKDMTSVGCTGDIKLSTDRLAMNRVAYDYDRGSLSKLPESSLIYQTLHSFFKLYLQASDAIVTYMEEAEAS